MLPRSPVSGLGYLTGTQLREGCSPSFVSHAPPTHRGVSHTGRTRGSARKSHYCQSGQHRPPGSGSGWGTGLQLGCSMMCGPERVLPPALPSPVPCARFLPIRRAVSGATRVLSAVTGGSPGPDVRPSTHPVAIWAVSAPPLTQWPDHRVGPMVRPDPWRGFPQAFPQAFPHVPSGTSASSIACHLPAFHPAAAVHAFLWGTHGFPPLPKTWV